MSEVEKQIKEIRKVQEKQQKQIDELYKVKEREDRKWERTKSFVYQPKKRVRYSL